uniref:LSDAT_euk domain-containing protein n=1 Tax=Macrostomum lignano TaxID=282301 RepID=A0A1I8HSQ2_9PLAT
MQELRPGEVTRRHSSTTREASLMAAGTVGSFGEIEFSGLKQQAKFVRVVSNLPYAAVQGQILTKKWELARPTLVINIFGGGFEKKRQLRMIFKKGLWKAAESAGCWIISSGFNVGIMKLTGEAVRDYSDAYGANHMIAFGVTSWGCVANRRVLERADGNSAPVSYQSEDTEQDEDEQDQDGEGRASQLPTRPSDEEETPLDPNHTHFFLVETGNSLKKGREQQFRSSLERAASCWKADDGSEVKVPMCGLLIGGDRYSLEQVYNALTTNMCPIVAVKGSAGAADALAMAMDIYYREPPPQKLLDKKEPETEEEKKERFFEEVSAVCQEYFNAHDYFDYQREVTMLFTLVEQYTGLIEIFDMEEDFDLDGKMISALLRSAGSDFKGNQLNLKQLKICLTLNRSDIARDKIFLENKKWKKGDLNDFMYQALMDDRHEFVKLLLEQGFSLENFLTVYVLERLYNDQIKRLNSKVAIFHQLWEQQKHREFDEKLRGEAKTDNGGAGGAVNIGIDGSGGSVKDLQNADRAPAVSVSPTVSSHEEHERQGSGSDGYDNPVMDTALEAAAAESMPTANTATTATKRGGGGFGGNKGAKSRWIRLIRGEQRELRSQLVTLDRPARELLIWSLLVGKLQMTELFWAMEKEPVAAALLSSKILKAMVSRTDDFTDKEDFLRDAELFENRAWGVLDQCYREDESRAQLLINRELTFYGDSSCIYLAAEAKTIKFMAHPCCQDFLTSTWMGKISTKNSFYNSGAKQLPKTSSDEAIGGAAGPYDDDENSDDGPNQTCSETCQQLRDFYTAPVIRFVYSTLSYLAFLFLFSYLLLFELSLHINWLECLVIVWIISLLLEEVKQATLSGDSFKTYISDGWNKLDCTAAGLFVIGFILRIIAIGIESKPFKKIGMLEYSVILTDEVFVSARIFYAFSLSAYFVRLMYIFSFHIALGPKLIMIGKMVVNDLIPFMVILMVFILGYGVSAQSIAYPIGLFTPDTTFTKGMPENLTHTKIFLQFLTRAWFQMFGDFQLENVQAQGEPVCLPACLLCDLVPIMLGIYVLLTNILMFNLLIAMFSSTYESVHQFSAQHWNYLRYNMIKEYLERSPLAPPFIVFWHVYELVLFIRLRCGYSKSSDRPDQLCVSYRRNAKKERELAKWEHMKAMDYLRQGEEMHGKKGGRGDSRSVIVRGVGGPGALPGATDMAKQMSDATSGIGMELEKKFKTVDSQLSKLGSDVETKVADLTGQVNALAAIARELLDNQERLLRRLTERSTETPIVAQDPRLEERVRESVLGIFNQPEAPPWFQEAARQAAVEALQQTPVAVAEVAEAAVEQMRAVRSAAEPPEQRRRRRRSTSSSSTSASVSSGDNVDGGEAAPTLRPRVAEPSTGRVVQFGCQGHRIWRFAPFNFERHQGMRMNVPPEKAAWEIEYSEYYAFDASDDTPVYPNEECHDLPTAALPSITFNQFDAGSRLRRQSLLGRYQLDPDSGAPLNPMGRTGLQGKGLLPRWGPNAALVVILTRWSRSTTGAIALRLGQPILQAAALTRLRQFCLPWFLTDHRADCDLQNCAPSLAKRFIGRRLKENNSRRKAKQEARALQKARVEQIFKGYLDDQLNADNAWIEAVVLNIHEPEDARFSDAMLKAFLEPECEEQARWMEVAYSTALRTSHCDLLKTVAGNHGAYF